MVTPLAVDGPTARRCPVVRGWSASPDDDPPPPTGTTELVGWLQPSEGTGAADDDPADDVLPQLRIADLMQRVDQDLYGGYASSRPRRRTTGPTASSRRPSSSCPTPAGSPGSATCSTPSSGGSSAAFALFIWWRWVRDERRRPRRRGRRDRRGQ